ncbi:NUDIX hydrolase [Aeromonas caviae]|uniref:NUDIX hydrolase n=2 Tax=Aeromonas caviae TaxID=648 RepID=UPI0038D237FD
MKITKANLIFSMIIFAFYLLLVYVSSKPVDFQNIILGLLGSAILPLMLNNNITDILFYFTKRYKLRRRIKNELNNSGSINNNELEKNLKKIFNDFFNKKSLDKKFIETATSYECAALMFALQNEKEPFNISTQLSVSDFKKIAHDASKDQVYRYLLLSDSLKMIGYDDIEKIEPIYDNEYAIGSELKINSDSEFYKRLLSTEQDEVIIFSTTSQISSDIIKIINNHHRNVSKISFYICSPLIKKDSAIENMFSEYNNPIFATPQMQFIENPDGSININIDAVRRVLKITSSIKNLIYISKEKEIEVEVNLFKKQYPGLKLKILKKKRYIQIQPGNLSYANNLYRFGVETDSSQLFDSILHSVDKYRTSNDFIETLRLTPDDIIKFENEILSELSLWLLEHGVIPDNILLNKEKLMTKIDDIDASLWIDSIIQTVRIARDNVRVSLNIKHPDSEDIHIIKYDDKQDNGIYVGTNSEGKAYHITVAAILIHDEKLLMIRKADPAYGHKFSIIAGHLENGESPYVALLREVKEELGITLREYIFIKKEVGVPDLCRYGLSLHDWYVFSSSEFFDINKVVYDTSEIEHLEWVSIKDLNSGKYDFTQGSSLILKKLGYIHE